MFLKKMDYKEDFLKSEPYLDTVRTLHQTVISLRTALEKSRSEIFELKTKAWPLENLESAITALSIENHLLRKRIVKSSEVDNADNIQEFETKEIKGFIDTRFKSLVQSLENINTTKLDEKSDNYEKSFVRKRSIDNLSQLDKSISTFTSSSVKNQSTCNKSNEETIDKVDDNFDGAQDLDIAENNITLDSGIVHENQSSPVKNEIFVNENLATASQKNVTIEEGQKRDKKFSVSISLDIYKKTNKKYIHVEQKVLKMEEKEDLIHMADTSGEHRLLQHSSSTDLLDQEVDDIELIFTNEDIKETNLKEPLISIDGLNEGASLPCAGADFDQNISAEATNLELEDDVFNDNFENENQENSNFQSQTFDFTRENSQIYNSKSDNSINHEEMKSYYSYQGSSFENKSLEKDESFDRFEERVRLVETDMSKVGIQDIEYSMGRRNTCPNPMPYRPMMHREAIGRSLASRKTRPILVHSNAIRRESGAQTDISALPTKSSWRSESSLAHKVKIGDNFTTLPSKYPLPGSRLRLSEKTVEARRILLSDIGFTSMVPELSRSADHLCRPQLKTPSVPNYGQFLKTTDLYSPGYTSQKYMWAPSPSESHSQSRFSSLYPLPSPPTSSRRCSAPVSPCRKTVFRHLPSKVRFANGSLPELRGDYNTTIDSGDSTDSLVEEAEQYLRRSIDCIVSGKDYYGTSQKSGRRASAPEAAGDNSPPQGWQPFLPRLPRDLRLDFWVKVISPEGRVKSGRVRYIGHLLSQSEQFVGVQLSTPDGHSDGTYNNRRYFQCEPYHGIFVPFKKVIMGWKP